MKSSASKINVEAALEGSPFENVSSDLAKEFEAANIIKKDQVGNAPIKLKRTFGVDLYEVMDLIIAYADENKKPKPASKATKKSPAKKG